MDLVVPVRPGRHNDELRYAMRSWEKNLQHFRQVWIVGSAPEWLSTSAVRFLPVSHGTGGSKYQRTTANLRAVLAERDLSTNFVLANDDMFAMEPTSIPMWHRGPVKDVADYYASRGLQMSAYMGGMHRTAELLRSIGFREPLSYELHVPMVINKHLMGSLLDTYGHMDALHKRTLYGVAAGVGGQYHPDVKVHDPKVRGPFTGPWLSTSDASFKGAVGAHIREAFPNRSSFERFEPRTRWVAGSFTPAV